jgi:hypothetical protein
VQDTDVKSTAGLFVEGEGYKGYWSMNPSMTIVSELAVAVLRHYFPF